MANDFQNAISNNIGTGRTDLYTTPSAVGKRSMLIGLELANISGNAITVDVDVYDASATAYVTMATTLRYLLTQHYHSYLDKKLFCRMAIK